MTDSVSPPAAPGVLIVPISPEFPPPGFPTLFADGVLNAAPSGPVVKFYLSRIDPGLADPNKFGQQAVLQVIMPTFSFIQTAHFFQKVVDQMIASGVITKEQYDLITQIQPSAPSS